MQLPPRCVCRRGVAAVMQTGRAASPRSALPSPRAGCVPDTSSSKQGDEGHPDPVPALQPAG